jgi:hypothetical protein
MQWIRPVVALCLTATRLDAQRGDTVVRMASSAAHAGVAELQRELAVGVADGDPNFMIGAINDIVVAGNGTMYVLDRSVPVIRAYDAAGKFVKNIGRRGRGPGEFQYAAGMAIGRNGNLLVWDPGNARINVYTAAGDVVTSWSTLSGSSTSSGRRLVMTDTSGTTYVHTFIWGRRPTGDGPALPSRGWMRFAPDGKLRDTVYAPAGPTEATLMAQRGGGTVTSTVPFAPAYYSAVSPLGYFVTGFASRMAVELHELGKPIVSIRREFRPAPVSNRERDSARSAITERMQRTDPAWSWNSSEIPRTKFVYSNLFVASDGRIWVELAKGPRFEDPNDPNPGGGVTMGGSRGRGPGRGSTWACPANGWILYDVYEPSGRYVGQVKTPERVEAIAMRGDQVWAAACTEDDVPQVVRYRIAWR